MLDEIVDGCANAKDYVQDSGYPDELLGERSSEGKVGPGENQGDGEDEDEEDDRVGVEGEVVSCIVDSTAIERFVHAVPLKRKTGNCGETEKGQYELKRVNRCRLTITEGNGSQVYQPTDHCTLACRV